MHPSRAVRSVNATEEEDTITYFLTTKIVVMETVLFLYPLDGRQH